MRAILLALMIMGCATAPAPELAMLNADARGGLAAIKAVRAVDMRVVEHQGDVDVLVHYRANRDGCMRVDVDIGGNVVFTEALTRSGGWNITRNMEREAANSAAGNLALRHGVEHPARLFALSELARRGHRLAAAGADQLDLTYADGHRIELHFDPTTHLLQRTRETKARHVDVDPTLKRIETRYSDYRAVAGVLFPFRSEEIDLDTGASLSVTEVTSVEVNTGEALAICTTSPPV